MEENNKNMEGEALVHDFNSPRSNKLSFSPKIVLIFAVVLLFGVGSGYLLSKNSSVVSKTTGISNGINSASVSKGTTVGSNDMNTFKDVTEGVLKPGGIEDEGTFHLERTGGASQNVYLTSSIVDLSKFVNKKIKVWGQTQKAKHAGWLMDVGKVEVL